MKKETKVSGDERILAALKAADKYINEEKSRIINTAGKENRPYLDEEEWKLARLDDIAWYLGKARFMAVRLRFNYLHDGNGSDTK